MSTEDQNNAEIKGRIVSINISASKGVKKERIEQGLLIEDFGLEGDAHAGPGIRQLSLLAIESINKQKGCEKVKEKGIDLQAGDFAENITTEGINLVGLSIGDRFRVGDKIILELSKIGKECHRYCSIYYKTGDCIMPREGIFARVIQGGVIKINDPIEVIK